jgi:hypothetical protein
MMLVRNFVGVTAYGYGARKVVVDASLRGRAHPREDLHDIINVALEELARQHYEPGFSTLLKIARAARSRVNREYQACICETLDATAKQKLFELRRNETSGSAFFPNWMKKSSGRFFSFPGRTARQ